MLVSAVVFLVKIYVQCGLVDAVLLLYRFFIRFHKIEPVKDAIGQDEARKELKLCRCVVFHTSKVRSFDTQTYLQVYVYVTLCHGSLQVSRFLCVFSIYVPFLISRVHPALRICPVIAYKKKMCIFVLFVPCYENTAVMYNYY